MVIKMVAFKPDRSCLDARLYYYDFIEGQGKDRIPGDVLEHFTECQHCQGETERLGVLLEHAGKDIEQKRRDAAIATVLKLHFAYVGKLVTCKTVKPFLPALAISHLRIRIPTPVTAHLDSCRACSDDLLTLRDLGLTDKQLCRLGQLFADKPAENTVSCSQARADMLAVTSMAFHETDAEILKHFCTCHSCREALYEYTETVRMDLQPSEMVQEHFACEAVSATDIYDYCIPYGIDPANDQYAKFRGPLTSHLRICPTCLARMQQLHNTIYEIAERADSGIVTSYELAPLAEEPEFADVDHPYAGWPVKVQVVDRPQHADAEAAESRCVAFPAASRQKPAALNLRRLIKPIAAAAAIFIVALLLLNGPAAKAVDLAHICGAIEKVKNVCISSFLPGKDEPTQRIWVSRTAGTKLQKTAEQAVLFDLRSKSRKTKDLTTGSVQTTTMTGDFLAKIESYITSSLGLMPFSDTDRETMTKDAQWIRVDNKDVGDIVPGTEVYDLAWTEKGWYRKWRVFVDPLTYLPKRIEWHRKSPIDSELRLDSVEVVTYLTDSEIEAAIQSTFGQP